MEALRHIWVEFTDTAEILLVALPLRLFVTATSSYRLPNLFSLKNSNSVTIRFNRIAPISCDISNQLFRAQGLHGVTTPIAWMWHHCCRSMRLVCRSRDALIKTEFRTKSDALFDYLGVYKPAVC